MRNPVKLMALIAGASLCLGGGLTACTSETAPASSGTGSSEGTPDIGGPFALVDQNGDTFTEADLAGRPYVMFFGFTNCPDICPYSLFTLGQASELMGEQADEFQYIFVSVDPERDTPEQMKLYAQSQGFPDNLIALTGTQEQIDNIVAEYRIYAARADDPSSAAGYTMDHTSYMYVMDENGIYVDILRHGLSPEDVAARLTRYLDTGE